MVSAVDDAVQDRIAERRRERRDGPCGAKSDKVSAIGSEVAAAGFQPGDRAALAHHTALAVERQNSVRSTVKKKHYPIGAEAARIDDPSIVAERAEPLSILTERQ